PGRDAVADGDPDLLDGARGRRRHVDRRLLGLEADERILGGHPIPDLDEDVGDFYVGYVAQIGYGDFHVSTTAARPSPDRASQDRCRTPGSHLPPPRA